MCECERRKGSKWFSKEKVVENDNAGQRGMIIVAKPRSALRSWRLKGVYNGSIDSDARRFAESYVSGSVRTNEESLFCFFPERKKSITRAKPSLQKTPGRNERR